MADNVYQVSLKEALAKVAPGTIFRLGLESVKEANTGALIVVGDSPELMSIVSGGFHIGADFTPARLYELAKMDGAIILNRDASRIIMVNVQLDPDASLISNETGIRHRTAERVAQQTGQLVVAISQRRGVVTLFWGQNSFRLRDISVLLAKANQALQTLEKYRSVFNRDLQRLGSLEFEDMATAIEVCDAISHGLRVTIVGEEIQSYIAELGNEGRLVRMQLDELLFNAAKENLLIVKDYNTTNRDAGDIMKQLLTQQRESGSDEIVIARMLGLGSSTAQLEQQVSSRGYRILYKIPRLPPSIIENLVEHFKLLLPVANASIEALDEVEGIGEVRALAIRNGLRHLREQLILDYLG